VSRLTRIAPFLVTLLLASCTTGTPSARTSTATPAPSPTISLSAKTLLARYCVDVVDAIDSLALGEADTLTGSVARLKADASSLSAAIKREEARLERFLSSPVTKGDLTPSRTGFRLAHTPKRCLDISGLINEIPVKDIATVPLPKYRAASSAPFGFAAPAPRSSRIQFSVELGPEWDTECVAYGLSTQPGMSLFTTDCASWDRTYNFFLTDLQSIGKATAHIQLEDFAIIDRSGAVLGPTDVRSGAETPDSFLPPEESLKKDRETFKFVVFSRDALHPLAIALEERDTLLVEVFVGKQEVVEPS
jgi:hypothetical protein